MSINNKEYRKIKHFFFMRNNPIASIGDTFDSNYPAIKKYIGRLCKESFFKIALTGIASPKQVAQLGKCGNMPAFTGLDRSLLWYTSTLKINADYINRFILARTAFDEAFLFGNYMQCQDLLDQITDQFGQSIWGICNQISLYGEMGDSERQKTYVQEVIREMSHNSFAASIVDRYGRQYEKDTSAAIIFNNLEREYKAYRLGVYSEFFLIYAQYKLYGPLLMPDISKIDENTLSYILFRDEKFSLIDRYLTLRGMVNFVFTRGSAKLKEQFAFCVAELGHCLVDLSFTNTVFYYQKEYSCFYPADNKIYQTFDSYYQGRYCQCLDTSSALLKESQRNFSLIEIYAKCCFFLGLSGSINGSQNLLDRISRLITSLMYLDGDCQEHQNELLKILYLHPNAVWSDDLAVILSKYIGQQSELIPKSDLLFAANFAQKITTPFSLYYMPAENLGNFMNMASESYRESVSVKLISASRKKILEDLEGLPIDEGRKMKYRAGILLEHDPVAAISLLNEVKKTNYGKLIWQKIDSMLICAELSRGCLELAMERFVEAFFINPNFVYIGHLSDIVHQIKNNIHESCLSVCAPIICNIYFESPLSLHDRDTIVLSLCLEQFMETLQIKKPSELLEDVALNTLSYRDIYFFNKVCVPNTMDRTLLFESQEDILRERIAICEALHTVDPQREQEYADEIYESTDSLLKEITKREIESGKIYLNLSEIRALVRKKVQDRYEKYAILRRENNNRIIESSTDNNSRNEMKNLSIQLEDILKTIRDIFVSDSSYGLDGYLSVEIRHGTLQGRIRGCFEKHF